MNQSIILKMKHFLIEILGLISDGKKEAFSDIEQHLCDGDIVEYISDKYKVYLEPSDSKKPLSSFFMQNCEWALGNEYERAALRNETDGLLLILAIAINNIDNIK